MEALGQGEIVCIIDRSLLKLVGKLQGSTVKTGGLAQLYARSQKCLQQTHRRLYTQFTPHDTPVKYVCHLNGHKVGRNRRRSHVSPRPSKRVGVVGVFLFKQPLRCQARVHDGEAVH